MKKIILITVLLVNFGAFAQKNVAKKVDELLSQNTAFTKYNVLNESNEIQNSRTDKAVTQGTFAKLNQAAIATIFANKENFIEVEIPYQGAIISIVRTLQRRKGSSRCWILYGYKHLLYGCDWRGCMENNRCRK